MWHDCSDNRHGDESKSKDGVAWKKDGNASFGRFKIEPCGAAINDGNDNGWRNFNKKKKSNGVSSREWHPILVYNCTDSTATTSEREYPLSKISVS